VHIIIHIVHNVISYIKYLPSLFSIRQNVSFFFLLWWAHAAAILNNKTMIPIGSHYYYDDVCKECWHLRFTFSATAFVFSFEIIFTHIQIKLNSQASLIFLLKGLQHISRWSLTQHYFMMMMMQTPACREFVHISKMTNMSQECMPTLAAKRSEAWKKWTHSKLLWLGRLSWVLKGKKCSYRQNKEKAWACMHIRGDFAM